MLTLGKGPAIFRNLSVNTAISSCGGDLASTGMEKSRARAEDPGSSLKVGKLLNANDTDYGYALAA